MRRQEASSAGNGETRSPCGRMDRNGKTSATRSMRSCSTRDPEALEETAGISPDRSSTRTCSPQTSRLPDRHLLDFQAILNASNQIGNPYRARTSATR